MFVSLNVLTDSNIEVLQLYMHAARLNFKSFGKVDHESCLPWCHCVNAFWRKSAILSLNYGARRRAVKLPKTNLKNILISEKSYVEQDLHVFILYMYIFL